MDSRMSRQHVRLSDSASGFSVECLGSNGVALHPTVGSATILKPGSSPGCMQMGDEIELLPGSHRFRLASDIEEELLDPVGSSKRQRMEERCDGKQSTDASVELSNGVTYGDGSEGSGVAGGTGSHGSCSSGSSNREGNGGDSNNDGNGGGSTTGGTLSGSDDWEGMPLPPLVQPPKPVGFAGMGALTSLALNPESHASSVFLLTREFVVAYDVYPKASVHLLILPRGVRIDNASRLDASHVGMLDRMSLLAEWLACGLRARTPSLMPFVSGFHAVPSMSQYAGAGPRACRGHRCGRHACLGLAWHEGRRVHMMARALPGYSYLICTSAACAPCQASSAPAHDRPRLHVPQE